MLLPQAQLPTPREVFGLHSPLTPSDPGFSSQVVGPGWDVTISSLCLTCSKSPPITRLLAHSPRVSATQAFAAQRGLETVPAETCASQSGGGGPPESRGQQQPRWVRAPAPASSHACILLHLATVTAGATSGAPGGVSWCIAGPFQCRALTKATGSLLGQRSDCVWSVPPSAGSSEG